MTTTNTAKSTSATAYLRVASRAQADCQALERQLRLCEQYARKRGRHIIDTYIDAGASRMSPRRPALDHIT